MVGWRDRGARWDRTGHRRRLRPHPGLGPRRDRRHPRPGPRRDQGLTLPSPGRDRRPGRRRGADRRPQGGVAARVERRTGRRHAGRPRGDRDLVPLPPGAARRPAARLRPACAWRSAATWWRWPSGWCSSSTTGPSAWPTARSAGPSRAPGHRSHAQPLHRVDRIPPRADGVVRDRRDPCRHGGAGGDGAPSAGGLAGAARRRHRGSDRASSRSASWPPRTGEWGRTPAGAWSRCWRCSDSSSLSRPSTWWSCSGWATRRRQRATRRSWPSPWSPPVWPPSSSFRCGPASSIRPPDSSTGHARLPTRSCGPSAAGSPAPSPWTSCCCNWPSRCARP